MNSRNHGTLLLLASLAVVLGPVAIAQRRPGRDAPPVFPDDKSSYHFRAQLDAGPKIDSERAALERLSAAKQWDEWLRRYQRLLDDHPDGLLAAGEERWVGLRRALEDRFQALPPAVHARYRRQYDGPAAAAFALAVSHADPAAVSLVYARYRFTSDGPRALAWLADRALDGGDAERAWIAFSRLIADARGPEPELVEWMAKAIIAGELSAHHSEATALAERLSTRLGDRLLKIEGHTLPARDWVRSRDQDSGPEGPNARTLERLNARAPLWPDFAGGPGGLRTMAGAPSPSVRMAWQDIAPGASVSLPDYYQGRRPRWGGAYRYPGAAPFSHLAFPTLADGRVYAQAPGQIRCLSLDDGRLLWSVREADLASQQQYPTPGGFRWWRPQRAIQTVAVVAGRLLLVRMPAGRYENDSSGWPAHFVLAALDARNGALLWQRAAVDGPPNSFYNLPAVSGQTVFTGISTSMAGLTEYRATALDAATGDRLWTTYLGSGSDPMAGVDGSPAAVRGGTVWVETCLHTVCALDALTGEIEWMDSFEPETNAPERSGWQDTMNVTNEPVSLIAPVGDRLLFCPRWGSVVVALNARTGHRAWSVDSGHCPSLVAVDKSSAILAGDQIRCLDPSTGRPRWTWTPPDRGRLGYPSLVGNLLVVPGGASLTYLDLATGASRGERSLKAFGAQPGAATVLVVGRRLLFSQADRLIALDEEPNQSLASRE